jgi:NAD+ diphosphatase
VKPLHLTPTKSVLDRSAELRQNPAALEKLWDNGKILHISNQRVLVEGDSLKLLNANEITKLSTDFSKGNKIFLGVLDDVGFFAYCTDIKSELREGFDAGENPNYKTLRELDGKFNEFELAICVHAQALSNWHHAHPRCSRCGETTSPAHGGTIRICDSDGSEHFPRVDPAIIVLLRDQSDRIILGRQKVWPERRFSNFAGFVEPGESFEQAVEREVMEEAGVGVSEIKYLGSQPWPFPASLMISFEAITQTPELVKPDGEEIEQIKVLSRSEFEREVAEELLLLPPLISVARKMIEAWRKG